MIRSFVALLLPDDLRDRIAATIDDLRPLATPVASDPYPAQEEEPMALIDRSIERLARRQYGAFTTAQVLGAGGTKNTIASRVRAGQWRREVRGVYTHTAFPRTVEQRLLCATLWHPEAAICGMAAPYVHELVGLAVEDESGAPLGRVRDILEGGGQDLLVVARDGRPDVLVPDVPEIVVGVDVAAGRMVVRPPEGLF